MLEVKANFHGKYSTDMCDLCEEEEDTTEHLFNCKELLKIKGDDMTVEILSSPTQELVEYLKLVMIKKKVGHLGSDGSQSLKQGTL